MNSEFWNIFQWNSNGFSNRIPIGIVPSPVGFIHSFNTHFGMWKVSPKTPHTQFLCRVHFHKLALKTHREVGYGSAYFDRGLVVGD
jgi:hypothetical protein